MAITTLNVTGVELLLPAMDWAVNDNDGKNYKIK
jgi:hypothetical protein